VQFEGEGEVIEWAVKMQRLPDLATLHERLGHGDVGVELIEALACRIASFHREAEASERTAVFGRFEVVARAAR
jgi:aminoglycoside phosphotransferase family enzyme